MLHAYHSSQESPATLHDTMDSLLLNQTLTGSIDPNLGNLEQYVDSLGLSKGLGIRKSTAPKCTIVPDRGIGGRFGILLVESMMGDNFNLYFNKMQVPLSDGNEAGPKTSGIRFLHFIVPRYETTLSSSREIPIYVERCDFHGNVIGRHQAGHFTYTHPPNRHSFASYFMDHQKSQQGTRMTEFPTSDASGLEYEMSDHLTDLPVKVEAGANMMPDDISLYLGNDHAATSMARRQSCPVMPDNYQPDQTLISGLPQAQDMGRKFSLPGNSLAISSPQSRARLHMPQNLDEPCRGWSDQEWQAKRRLIRFYRYQNGNVIHTAFETVPQDMVDNSRAVVSCIFWEERNECFVTSVDTIYLLESLVNIRFNVEEKNRIRRNLEGFKPLTVTKGHPESGEFFKLIMGFPNPKPRNIEKDIKVFPWRILGHALRKIINKYSASYPDMI